MRHRKSFNRLGRPAGHRRALLVNLSKSLIQHKRIVTTVEKAKELRKFVEPVFTKLKTDTMHSRRIVFSLFQDKDVVKELFNEIAGKIAQRAGGYTRIIKLGNRVGDNAQTCLMELVDYNDLYKKRDKPVKTTRRGRGKSKVTSDVPEATLSDQTVSSVADGVDGSES